MRSAGHPPAALRSAGLGPVDVLATEGPILGVVEDATFTCAAGALRRDDALLLYTDGMVERPRRDIDLGIDRMLGEAEQMLRGGVVGSAQRLVDTLGSRVGRPGRAAAHALLSARLAGSGPGADLWHHPGCADVAQW